MDYSTLIDAETWAFIRRTEEWYPPDAVDLSIAEQRRIYDAMCRAFFEGYPEGVRVGDLSLGGVPCRLYEPGESAVSVVYFHSGGFVVGGLDSHDDVCAEIAAATELRVISVDYRLAPEHPHPAAFEDCLAATRAVAERWGGRLVLAGDSAGGNLAAAVAHRTRSELPLAGQVLIYPGLGGVGRGGSYAEHAEAPMLTTRDVAFYAAIRCGGAGEPARDPTYAPLMDEDFAGLPPTAIVTAQCDPLADDGAAYKAALDAAGVPAGLRQEAGLVHGYLRARSNVGRAKRSFARITGAIGDLAAGRFAPGSF